MAFYKQARRKLNAITAPVKKKVPLMQKDAPELDGSGQQTDTLRTTQPRIPLPEMIVKPRGSSAVQQNARDSEKIVWQRPHRRNSIVSPSSEVEKKTSPRELQAIPRSPKKDEQKRKKSEEAKAKKKENGQKHEKGQLQDSESSGSFETSSSSLTFSSNYSGPEVIEVVTSDSMDETKLQSKGFASDSEETVRRRASFRQSWTWDGMGDKKKSISVETSDLNGPPDSTDMES